MLTLESLTTDDVLRRFGETHPAPDPASRACNEYAEGVLRLAGEQRGDRWHRVALTGDDVAAVLLPWHVGEYGEREPVPPSPRRSASCGSGGTTTPAPTRSAGASCPGRPGPRTRRSS